MPMYGQKVVLDTARIHDFGCIDERRKHLDEKDESTQLTLARGPVQARWSPYVDNGGTALAIAGKGYVLVAADTRMSLGYSIESRDSSKMTQLTNNCVIATCGMQADRATFHKNVGIRLRFYEHRNQGRTPGVHAIASLVSTMLYNRRFFPFYCFNMVCGLNDKGDGVVYGYDAVGCIEAQPYGSTGSAHEMVEPYLDTKIRRQHDRKPGEDWQPPTQEEAYKMTESIFHAIAERDIYTGDKVEVCIITAAGVEKKSFELRKD